jgi:penicillin-binding protein 2
MTATEVAMQLLDPSGAGISSKTLNLGDLAPGAQRQAATQLPLRHMAQGAYTLTATLREAGGAILAMDQVTLRIRTRRERWYPGETISVSIGQGAVSVTPLQLALSIGGLSIGGTWFQPHLVKLAATPEPKHQGNWNPLNVATVVSGMYGVVNEGGTGTAAAIPGITVAGKTGSAQQISNDLAKSNKELAEEFADNGWFVGFAPRDNPEIVVAAIVEAGIHGGQNAAPITRDILKTYFDKKAQAARPNPANLAALLKLQPRPLAPAVH